MFSPEWKKTSNSQGRAAGTHTQFVEVSEGATFDLAVSLLGVYREQKHMCMCPRESVQKYS